MTPDRVTIYEELLRYPVPAAANLSPDGLRAVFELWDHANVDKDTGPRCAIHLVDLQTAETRLLAGDERSATCAPCWSPDGRRLAFTSNRANKQEDQLYTLDLRGGEAQPLTDLRGSVHDMRWLPDSGAIAFLYNGTLDKEAARTPDPQVLDANPHFDRLWQVELGSRVVRALSPEGLHVFEYALSADGSRALLIAARHPNPAESWYHARLYILRLDSGENRELAAFEHQIACPVWSPDGRAAACIHGLLSDQGHVGGELVVVDIESGAVRNVTPGIDHTITWIEWRTGGILYGGRQRSGTLLGWVEPNTGSVRTIWDAPMSSIGGGGSQRVSLAQDGKTFAAIITGFDTPPEIYTGLLDGSPPRPVTQLFSEFYRSTLPPLNAESIEWQSSDGTTIQGFVVYPHDVSDRRYPLVVWVHGGPSASWPPGYGLGGWHRLLAARGCVILMPNPRGSWGRGHAFQAANLGDLGGGDWQDINSGVDALIARGIADPNRLAISGWSYGGYMTAWAVTQTDRFKCAVAGAPVINFESNYGIVSIREWQTILLGSMLYDRPDLHRERSPLTHVKNVKTPVLLLHGEKDIDVPAEQSIEFYTALRHFGVDTECVIYPREPHGPRESAHRRDVLRRVDEWISRWLELP